MSAGWYVALDLAILAAVVGAGVVVWVHDRAALADRDLLQAQIAEQGQQLDLQADHIDMLLDLIDDVRGWALDVHGHLFGVVYGPEPAPGPPTEPFGPPTAESSAVDLWARQESLLARLAHVGQHRA